MLRLLVALVGAFCCNVPQGTVFNIVDYGGVGDGTTLNTAAFEKAVTAIAANTGGTLLIPAGQWLTGPFNFTSHMILYVCNGAIILGVPVFNLWPVIPALPSYGQGRDHIGPRYTSLLHGEHLTNVTITGEGNATIDGQGQVWWDRHKNGTEPAITRGHLIEFMYTDHLAITNILVQNSPFWTIHPWSCYNVTVRDVVIRAPAGSPNTDGIDPDSSDTVLIENVDYFGGDDGIAIKSGWDCFGEKYGKPTSNVFIRNMTIAPHNCIAIGSEMSGGVVNVTVEDVTCTQSGQALYIKSAKTRGGYVKNITYQHISIGSASVCLAIQQDYGDPNPSCPFPPKLAIAEMDNIHYLAVSAQQCGAAAQLIGYNKTTQVTHIDVEQVHLNNCSSGWQCSNVQGIAHDVTPQPCKELTPVDLWSRFESAPEVL